MVKWGFLIDRQLLNNFSFLSSAYVKTDTIKISTQTNIHEISKDKVEFQYHISFFRINQVKIQDSSNFI